MKNKIHIIAGLLSAAAVLTFAGIRNLLHDVTGIVIFSFTALVVGAFCFKFLKINPRRIIAERPRIAINDLFEQYYSKSDFTLSAFSSHWTAIAEALGEQAEQLRPTDRLSIELAARGSTDFSNDQLIEYAQPILGDGFKLEAISTLDQLVRALCAAKQNPPA